MITREADYSVRAILYLSSKWPDGYPIAASILAEKMDIPYRFLRRIVRKLADGGFVVSERGRTGGVRLAKAPDSISLYDVLDAIDPKALRFNACLDAQTADCKRQKNCPVHTELRALQSVVDGKLSEVRFSQLEC